MNGNRTPRDLGPLLESWMASAAPDRAPERLLEEAFSRTMGTRQLRAYPWHGVRSRRGSRSTGRRTRDLAIAMVAVAITVVVGVGLLLPSGHEEVGQPSPSIAPTPSATASPSPSASAISPGSPPPAAPVTPQAVIPIANPLTLVSDGSTPWLFTSTGELERLDPATNKAAASVQLPSRTDQYQAMAGNSAGLWVTDWDTSQLLRLDPRSLKLTAQETVGPQPKGVLLADSSVWIANTHGGTVDRIDPARDRIAAMITVGPTGSSGPNWLAEGFSSIWVDVPNNGTVVRIDPATNAIQATIAVGAPADPCGGLAVTSDSIWVGSCDSPSQTRIDPATNRVVGTFDLPGFGHEFVVIGDHPWVSPEASGRIARIDPATNTIDRLIDPGSGFAGGGDLTVADASVWIVDAPNNRVLRLPIAAFGG